MQAISNFNLTLIYIYNLHNKHICNKSIHSGIYVNFNLTSFTLI